MPPLLFWQMHAACSLTNSSVQYVAVDTVPTCSPDAERRTFVLGLPRSAGTWSSTGLPQMNLGHPGPMCSLLVYAWHSLASCKTWHIAMLRGGVLRLQPLPQHGAYDSKDIQLLRPNQLQYKETPRTAIKRIEVLTNSLLFFRQSGCNML